MTYSLTRIRGASTRVYNFELEQEFEEALQQQIASIGIPGRPASEALGFTLNAQTGVIRLSWTIRNNGADRSVGTAPESDGFVGDQVRTVDEQIRWLREFIFNGQYGVKYTLSGSGLPSGGISCLVRDYRVVKSARFQKLAEGTMVFQLGRGL